MEQNYFFLFNHQETIYTILRAIKEYTEHMDTIDI